MRDVLSNPWMVAAVFVEILGFIAAMGTIPGLVPFPVAAMLSATAILSSLGVVIVTIYFVLQYHKRPLNTVQKEEINETLGAYLTQPESEKAYAAKYEFKDIKGKLHSLFNWNYQNSVLDFASEVQKLYDRPGYIVVAKLEIVADDQYIIRFWSVPPPECVVDAPRGSAGDNLPEAYRDYGMLLRSDTEILVVYLGIGNQLRALRSDPERGGVIYYYEELSSPVHSNTETTVSKPLLNRNKIPLNGNEWYWDTEAS